MRVAGTRRTARAREPKYWAVIDFVEKLISSQGLAPGDPLPAESVLQERFKISRGTVRMALEKLTVAGVVERRSGSGTFVAVPRMVRALPELTGFSEHIRSQGLRPGSQLLSKRALPEGSEAGAEFPPGTALVEFARLRLADDQPVGLHYLVLPADIAAAVDVEDQLRQGTLYERMEQANLTVDVAQEHIVARRSVRSEARLLDIAVGSAVLDVRRKTFDADGNLVELVHAVYRGDRYDYVIWLERRPK